MPPLAGRDPAAPVVQLPAPPPKRGRGRPRKDRPVGDLGLDLAAAMVPIPDTKSFHKLEEKWVETAEFTDEAE